MKHVHAKPIVMFGNIPRENTLFSIKFLLKSIIFSFRWNGRYLPDRSNSENYGSISEIVEENDDFAVYNAPKHKKVMLTMGSMDINATCDDGKVWYYFKYIYLIYVLINTYSIGPICRTKNKNFKINFNLAF